MIDVNVENQLISRTAKVIMYIKENGDTNVKQISKNLEIDYNFVSKIIQRCEEAGILKSEMENREKKIQLVKKGEKLSELLKQIEKIL